MLIFDIGFNEGNFTKYIRSIYPDSQIVGVDGHPGYVDLYHKNPIDGASVLWGGVVSNVNSHDCKMTICDSNPGINSINSEWIRTIRHSHFFERTSREIAVRSYTLDALIEQYGVPDLIKLDIEGAESMALSGLSQKCGTILWEFSEEWFHDAIKCVEKLKSLGYKMFAIDIHTEGDGPREYNQSLSYYSWEYLKTQIQMDPLRKKKWGMMYAK